MSALASSRRSDPSVYQDPWSTQRPQRQAPHLWQAGKGAVLVVKGNNLVFHDRSLAAEFLQPFQQAYAGSIINAMEVTVQSPSGEGWRSKAMQKQQAKLRERTCSAAASKPHVCTADVASLEAEIQSRLAAVEEALRAHVQAVIRDGFNHHATSMVVDKAVSLKRNTALHSFNNSCPFDDLTLQDHKRIQRSRGHQLGHSAGSSVPNHSSQLPAGAAASDDRVRRDPGTGEEIPWPAGDEERERFAMHREDGHRPVTASRVKKLLEWLDKQPWQAEDIKGSGTLGKTVDDEGTLGEFGYVRSSPGND